MVRKQEGRREDEEEEGRSSQAGAKIEPATTLSVAEEATIASAGNNQACSDGRGRKDECGGGKGTGIEY